MKLPMADSSWYSQFLFSTTRKAICMLRFRTSKAKWWIASYTMMNVREQNFGRPSTIWVSRTSSIKGPLEGSRQARRRSKPAKRNLSRFNRCSTGAIARACAPSLAGETSGSAIRKLETLKHISDRRATGTQTFEHMCTHKIIRPVFWLALQRFTSEGFHLEIFNWTFLLILKGSRRDLILHQRRSWPLFDFHHAPSINCFECRKSLLIFYLSAYNRW